MKSLAILLILIGMLNGCRTFPGNIGFESTAPKKLWVQNVEGFERNPPVGNLSQTSSGYSRMGSMKMPDQVTIHWSYQWFKDDFRSIVSLKDIRMPVHDEELMFRFTESEKWEVYIKKYR